MVENKLPELNSQEYIEATRRTDAPLPHDIPNAELLHYALGLVTEAGEIADILKKNFAYGKPIDFNHLKEELGDLDWYKARILDLFEDNTTEGSIRYENIQKLKARFPDKFDANKALNRNLENENQILKKSDSNA